MHYFLDLNFTLRQIKIFQFQFRLNKLLCVAYFYVSFQMEELILLFKFRAKPSCVLFVSQSMCSAVQGKFRHQHDICVQLLEVREFLEWVSISHLLFYVLYESLVGCLVCSLSYSLCTWLFLSNHLVQVQSKLSYATFSRTLTKRSHMTGGRLIQCQFT